MKLEHKLITQINEAIEKRREQPRSHMGCSTLGHPCDRWLWLSYRWAVVEQFSGRMLRLFRRGQNEERVIISDLRANGYNVTNTQTRVTFGASVAGSIDGQMIFEGKNHILEFKTHSKKSFAELEKKGVKEAKFAHYVQVQIYMYGCAVDRALYIAVCKDNDEMYVERLKLDKAFAEKYISRGRRLSLDDRLPPPITTDSDWFECKFCEAHDFCHGSKIIKKEQVNCRTCAHSTSTENGFICERHDGVAIPEKAQSEGCDSHVIHPDLVQYKAKEHDSKWKIIYMIENKEVVNGEGEWASGEILANPKECANPSEMTLGLKREFGGKLC